MMRLAAVVVVASLAQAAGPSITLERSVESRVSLLTPVEVAWRADGRCRHRLEIPGSGWAGFAARRASWSRWAAPPGSARYDGFVKEGEYRFRVQCRNDRGTSETAVSWEAVWEVPEVREAALEVDWRRVARAGSRAERFRLLASEYREAHEMWLRAFDYHARALKLTTSPEEIVEKLSVQVVEANRAALLAWADRSTSITVSKLLAPKLLADLVREGVLDLVLIYRNLQANRAASMAIATHAAWQCYAEAARRAE